MTSVLDYTELVSRTRELVASSVPEDSVVAVVTKGDPELLKLGRREGWHFPRTESGAYAGHHPADDADAVARLEALRRAGASFLVLPATAYWWLDHYSGFDRHLRSKYALVAERADTAVIFALEPRNGESAVAAGDEATEDPVMRNLRDIACALLPPGATVVIAAVGDQRPIRLGDLVAVELTADDEASIVDRLDALSRRGARYLILPKAAEWWLDRYSTLRSHLELACSLVTQQENVCTIYDLEPAVPAARTRRSSTPRPRHDGGHRVDRRG